MREFYGHTNESLWAIVAGMDVAKKDRVLSICSSGDQAFALGEYANEVVAVDINTAQINYAKRRLEALKNENYNDFFPLFDDKNFPKIKREKFDNSLSKEEKFRYLCLICSAKTTEEPKLVTWAGSIKYFLGEEIPFLKQSPDIFDDNKICKIKKGLDRISFQHGDIIDILRKDNHFSRVYFSNALLSRKYCSDSRDKVLNQLGRLPRGCLIYFADANSEKREIPSCWILEEELSERAKRAELNCSWHPRVYKKVV
ncbi:MAG: DUF3419 family protein [Candidatus Nanoarchaeia archaeon]|nr:DUF3419 family protein [Candidatus Nanoarchaeia archaeon]MDD5741048.1 DUF3419 family protein [Candidatus Nanoarchaeia archaeon]